MRVSLCSIACGYPIFPAPLVKGLSFLSLSGLAMLVEGPLPICVRVLSVIAACMSVFMLVSHCFHHWSIGMCLKSESRRPPTSSALAIFSSGCLVISHKFRVDFSVSGK